MRSRIFTAVGISAVALAVAFSFSGSASAAGHSVGAVNKSTTHQSKINIDKGCYAQRDNDSFGIVSQNFEASFDIYDSQGADDFAIKKKCKVKTVTADGAYF